MKCTRTIENTLTYNNTFGTLDSKQRMMGTSITTFEAHFTPAPEAICYYDMTPGSYYAFTPQATRNGKKYGALQSSRYFATEKDRQAAIVEYLANAAIRAYKQMRGK